MTKKSILVTMLLSAHLAATSAAAQEGFDTARIAALLAGYDADGDGALAGAELTACGCAAFDLDRNARVSLAEFAGGLIIFGEAALPPMAAPAAPAAAVETRTFVNARDGLTGPLAEFYVPFSFDYPAGWDLIEDGRQRGAMNYVKVERSVDGFTSESFSVGHVSLPGGAAATPDALLPVVEALQQMLAQGFPNFQPIATGTASLGGRTGRYLTFVSHIEDTPKGPVDIWGRALIIPAGEDRGILAMMLATPVGTELQGPADVGRIGELPVILESFAFGG